MYNEENCTVFDHWVVYTTRDTATIHTPKCRQLKITWIFIGTDTVATKSGRDPEQTPTGSWHPENKASPHTAESQIRMDYFTYGVTSHAKLFIFIPAKRNKTPHELTDSWLDRLRTIVLYVYCHNHKYHHFWNIHVAATDVRTLTKMLGISLAFHLARTKPHLVFHFTWSALLIHIQFNLMHIL